jgi:hypothetical protein
MIPKLKTVSKREGFFALVLMQVSLRCGSQSHSKQIVGPQQPHHGGRYRQQ